MKILLLLLVFVPAAVIADAASLGSAGAVAAIATARNKPKVAAAEAGADKADGYRASPHVLKYYKTTEV